MEAGYVARCAPPGHDRGLEDCVDSRRWDHELAAIADVSLRDGPTPRQHAIQSRNDVLKVLFAVDGRCDAIKRTSLLVERESRAAEHLHPRNERPQLAEEVRLPPQIERRRVSDLRHELLCASLDFGQAVGHRFGLRFPFWRPVVRVDVVSVVLSEGEHELDV